MKKINKLRPLLLAFVLLAALPAGCGVKPNAVDAPAGVSPDPFPQTYPPARPQAGKDGALSERYLPDNYTPAAPTP